jgi:hypothetical protein
MLPKAVFPDTNLAADGDGGDGTGGGKVVGDLHAGVAAPDDEHVLATERLARPVLAGMHHHARDASSMGTSGTNRSSFSQDVTTRNLALYSSRRQRCSRKRRHESEISTSQAKSMRI